MALKLDILANTSQLTSEMKKSGDAIEGVSDKLDGLATSASDAGSKAESSLEGVGDAAKDATKAVDTAGSDAASSLEGITTGAEDAGTGLGGLSGVAAQVLAGDIPSAAQSAEDALGGIGELAGVGGPVVTALVTLAQIIGETMGAAAEEAQRRTSTMFDDMVESGNTAVSTMTVLAEAQSLIADDKALTATKTWADTIGIDLDTAILAVSGDAEALATAQQKLNEKMESDAPGTLAGKYVPAINALRDTADAADSAVGKAKLMDEVTDALRDSGAAADAASGQVSSYADQLNRVPKDVTSKVTVDLDDSAIRNYRPPKIYVQGEVMWNPSVRQPV